MITTRSMLTAILAAALLTTQTFAAEAQCSALPEFLIYQPTQPIDGLLNLAKSGGIGDKSDLIAVLNSHRLKFWQTYAGPDPQAAARSRDLFAALLWLKDIYFLKLTLQMPQSRDLTNRRGSDFGANVQDMLNGLQSLDGGIPRAASPEFAAWADAVSKALGPEPRTMEDIFAHSFNVAAMSPAFLNAVNASQERYKAYVRKRDWAEFDAKGVVPRPFDAACKAGQPCNYPVFLYARYNGLSNVDACTNYSDMRAAFQDDATISLSANKVRVAAKTPHGLLVVTAPPPMKKTPSGQSVEDSSVPMPPGVIGVYADPVNAFEILATQDDKRRYLLYLLSQHNSPDGRVSYIAHKWAYATKAYKQLQVAFGEQDLLSAAESVRTAKIRMTSGTIINQAAIGATRNDPFEAFEDILARKNPKGYVRLALAGNQNLETPAAVQAAYNKFVASHGEKQTLEAASYAAAGKPSLTYNREIETLERDLANPTALAAGRPSATSVESTQYQPWKGFPAISKATYISRPLQLPRAGTNDLVPGSVQVRTTYSLQAVSSEHADVWQSEIVYDYPGGIAHPPHETEFDYPAQYLPRAGDKPPPIPVKSGEQTLTIAGRTLRTHWQTLQPNPTTCPDFLITTWTSPEVPGELVRKIEDINCRGSRRISETLLESIQGTRSPAALDEATRRIAASGPLAVNSSDSTPFPMVGSHSAAGLGTDVPQTVAPSRTVGTATPGPLPSPRTIPPASPAASAQTPRLAVPQGTQLFAHLAQMVDSSRSRPDTIYFGSLDQPLMVNGVQVAPSATPVRAKLLQLPNGAGFTLVLTDITIAGRQSALTSSQVAVSSNRTAQSNAVASALSQIPGAGGAAAKARAEREAAMRAQQQGNTSRQVLLSGTEVHVPPMTPLVFTLAGESVP